MNEAAHRFTYLAAEGGHAEVMAALIEAGANPESLDSNGTTPLHDAAYGGHVDTVKVLLRARAKPLC